MQAEPSIDATGSTEEYIRLEAVRKSFADKPVLRGVDLAIRRGETMVILGASGSGKSVLLRHVNGLHKPDSGRVCVDGEEISKWGEVVSTLDQTASFYLRHVIGALGFSDLFSGLGKSVFFALFISVVGCYNGLQTRGGAGGVGRYTTHTVVTASILILISDFFLTKLFLLFF